jgi:hypothetical protein
LLLQRERFQQDAGGSVNCGQGLDLVDDGRFDSAAQPVSRALS